MSRLPNILTVSRLFFTVAFIWFLSQGTFAATVASAVFFTIASVTDFYDGYYAKKYRWESNFGKLMDPIADKFLLLSAFFIFWAKLGIVPFWIVAAIGIREIVVTCARFVAMSRGTVLAAEQAGKMKTVLQISSVSFLLVLEMVKQSGSGEGNLAGMLFYCAQVLLHITVVLTIISGVLVLWNSRKIILGCKQ